MSEVAQASHAAPAIMSMLQPDLLSKSRSATAPARRRARAHMADASKLVVSCVRYCALEALPGFGGRWGSGLRPAGGWVAACALGPSAERAATGAPASCTAAGAAVQTILSAACVLIHAPAALRVPGPRVARPTGRRARSTAALGTRAPPHSGQTSALSWATARCSQMRRPRLCRAGTCRERCVGRAAQQARGRRSPQQGAVDHMGVMRSS